MTHWTTRLIHPGARAATDFSSLTVPVYRGSTVVFPSAESANDDWREEAGYTYGLFGTPTTRELAGRVAQLEGGRWTFLTPGGQASIALIYLALADAGDHVLVPDSIYGPNRDFATTVLGRYGVDVEFYPPTIGVDIASRLRANTRLVWCESPGSVTMEVQDVPAIAAAAHARGAIVALDNTYAAGIHFDAFAHGVDVTMQALTKYVGGHSDLLLGTVTVRDRGLYERLGPVHGGLGLAVSPDECSLALRGLQTLGVRLEALERSTLALAAWLHGRAEVETVLHPAMPSCPGHDLFTRDFTGSTSLFSIVLRQSTTREQVAAFVDALSLFKIGYSWGGVTSLAVPWFSLTRTHGHPYGHRLVRFNVGLERVEDLIADLEQGFHRMTRRDPRSDE
jgi:cysteine-S-conjugate beta-lyase